MIKNLMILIATVLVCLVIGEVTLRAVVEEVNFLRPDLMEHPVLRHAIVPGSNGHDEWGFRNLEVPPVAQIITIGDSQTYGTAVPANASWPAVLERMAGTSVYNMGVGGYGPPDYHYLLNERAGLLKPCLVLVGFYFGNDLPRSYQFAKQLNVKSVTLDGRESGKVLKGLRLWLTHNSLTYQMAKAFGDDLINLVRFYEPRSNTDGEMYPVVTEYWRTVLQPQPRFAALDQRQEANRVGLSASLQTLSEIQEDCLRLNTRCLIVLIPTKLTVYWPSVRDILTRDGLKEVRAAVTEEAKVREAVLSHLKEQRIGFVDPTEALQTAAREEGLYPANAGGHLNVRGNEVLAVEILENLGGLPSCRGGEAPH
jgi:hypothetical protein